MEVEKTYCRIWKWYDDHAIIELYLPNGELLRSIKGELYQKLYKLTNGEIDADFYFVAKKDNRGVISVDIEKYVKTPEEIEEMDKLFKELEDMME